MDALPPATLLLTALPLALCTRVVAAACDTPEALFQVGAACRSLRAAAGAAGDPATAALWSRVMAFLDPAGVLARLSDREFCAARDAEGTTKGAGSYATHARRAGGWHALAHALASRRCYHCGAVTCWVAFLSDDTCDGSAALRRACPGPCVGPHFGAVRSEEQLERTFEARPVMNALTFARDDDDHDERERDADSGAATELDADALGASAPAALQAAVSRAHDGDTLLLRGTFVFPRNTALRSDGGAVRLLGAPRSVAYAPTHDQFYPDEDMPAASMHARLAERERDAAGALGFPSAAIHHENAPNAAGPETGVSVARRHALWVENVYLSAGDRDCGLLYFLQPLGGGNARLDARVSADKSAVLVEPAAALVLRSCWLTGYLGTALALMPYSAAALLRCAVTNGPGSVVTVLHRRHHAAHSRQPRGVQHHATNLRRRRAACRRGDSAGRCQRVRRPARHSGRQRAAGREICSDRRGGQRP